MTPEAHVRLVKHLTWGAILVGLVLALIYSWLLDEDLTVVGWVSFPGVIMLFTDLIGLFLIEVKCPQCGKRVKVSMGEWTVAHECGFCGYTRGKSSRWKRRAEAKLSRRQSRPAKVDPE